VFLDFFEAYSYYHFLLALVIVAVMIVVDKLVRIKILKYGTKMKLEPHAINILRLISRIILVASGLAALLGVFGVSSDLLIGVSALSGAAIGFASTQTIGNFLAGIYVMISKPFVVKDYVRIGDVEGEVTEITINYTQMFTPQYNNTKIPNKRVLDSTIVNYSGKKGVIDYAFRMEFPHLPNKTNEQLLNDCLKPTIEKYYEQHQDILISKPEVYMSVMGTWSRTALIRLVFPKGKINKFYKLQSELVQEILNSWDIMKRATEKT
jgi:small conductance mechanosensitive channel